MPRITLEDVAKIAGVSSKTVSRVLNNEPNVASETFDKVQRTIAELNYVPNLAARNLSRGRSMAIGLTMGWPVTSAFTSTLIDFAMRESAENGYSLALFSLETGISKKIVDAFRGKQIDGIILDTRTADDQDLIYQLDSLNVPYVVIHPNQRTSFEKTSIVRIDDQLAAQQATDYLIRLGHASIGLISHDLELKQQDERLKGYLSALKNANLPFRDEWIAKGSGSEFQVGFSGILKLLPHNQELSAIFMETDEIAMGALSALWKMGMKVPDDISVIGFDDIPYASMIVPPLTTIHQPIDKIASVAVKQLIKAIDDPNARPIDIVMPTRLVIRDTCKARTLERAKR